MTAPLLLMELGLVNVTRGNQQYQLSIKTRVFTGSNPIKA
jgi:hypothetical protein